ncbi:MAG: DUF4038 domain-containing protein, partial [Acidimicrobiia bacterium]|nr:DUF4038 domain-containing protein [Acidimicrobiia bacterium]
MERRSLTGVEAAPSRLRVRGGRAGSFKDGGAASYSVVIAIVGLVLAFSSSSLATATNHFDVYDTAWELPVYSIDSELDAYMQHLSGAGFTGVWISVAPISGQLLNEQNSHGQTLGSFGNPNSAYFDHIDHILTAANNHNIKVGLVVGWAQKYVGNSGAYHNGGNAPLTTSNARAYGSFLANRYANNPAVGMWVFGGDYFSISGGASDELNNVGVWQELKAGLVAGGADQATAYHGHHYVQGIWNQSFFDIAAPLTGHCSPASEARQELASVLGQTSKPVIAAEMRYEDFVADWCPGGNMTAGPQDVLDDVAVAVEVGTAGLVYGHDDRWDWAADGGQRPSSSLGSGGEVLMMSYLGYGAGGPPPTARADNANVVEGNTVSIPVMNNDTYASSPSLSVSQFPARGTIAINGTTIAYTHDGSETTSDSFQYRLQDGNGGSIATVNVSVMPRNDPPDAMDDYVTVAEGATASLDVLQNDLDPDNTLSAPTIVSQPVFGTATVSGTNIVYVHDGSEPADDSIMYSVSDGEFADTATVNITISQTNDAPTIQLPQQQSMRRGEELRFTVSGSDPEGDRLTITVDRPGSGTAYTDSLDVVFVPDPEFSGYETLTVRLSDGEYEVSGEVPVHVRHGGVAGVVLFDPASGMWHIPGEDPFFYGNPGDMPLFGDWDNDGIDTVGMFRPSNGFVYLRNSNDFGVADIELFYGIAGDIPLVGDWDNDGFDTLAVFRDSRIFVSNELVTGPAEFEFFFGEPGDRPFAGDFNG